MRNFLVLILSVVFFCGCKDDDPDFRDLNVSSIDLIDCPNSAEENVFQCRKDDTGYLCSFTTVHIRKLQNIESINARVQGRDLSVFVRLDKDLFPAPPDRKTQVDFVLHDLPKGKYVLNIFVENAMLNMTPAVWDFD